MPRQESFVPTSVKSLISMMLHGPNFGGDGYNPYLYQAVLTVSQFVMYNTVIRASKQSSQSYHSKQQGPSIPVYLAQLIHSKTRKPSRVDKICHLRITISSDRLQLQWGTPQ